MFKIYPEATSDHSRVCIFLLVITATQFKSPKSSNAKNTVFRKYNVRKFRIPHISLFISM